MSINSLGFVLDKYWQYKPYLLVMEKWVNTIIALREETLKHPAFNTRLLQVVIVHNRRSPCSKKWMSVSSIRSGAHKHCFALISQLRCFCACESRPACYAIIPAPLGSSFSSVEVSSGVMLQPKIRSGHICWPRIHVTLTWVRWLIGWAL